MSGPFGSSQWMYQSAAGFYPTEIEQSLRINDNDSAFLSRAFTAGDRRTWTFSTWVKRGNLGSTFGIFGSNTSTNVGQLYFDTNNKLTFYQASGNGLKTSAVFRDTSAWYHIVFVLDTTQATQSDRRQLYVNGTRITAFDNENYPSQNAQGDFNNSYTHFVGKIHGTSGAANYFDGYQAEINFIDGQALDPTDFGEFKSGVWVAKEYTGSYGTNGFYLNFSDSANIGDDTSGNTNDWTANNLAATDVLLDSPTNNFCTFNAAIRPYPNSDVLSEGNLRRTNSATGVTGSNWGTFNVTSGKWYYEVAIEAAGALTCWIGWANDAIKAGGGTYTSAARDNAYMYMSNGNKALDSATGTAYGASYTTGDVIGVALDADNETITFYKNGVSQGVAFTGISTVGSWIPAISSDPGWIPVANFGQDSSFAGNKPAQGNTDDNGIGDFFYPVPSGYLALAASNLPNPTIDPAKDDSPQDYFNTVLYTGNGSTQSITGVGFQPDLVWAKNRDFFHGHWWTDAVRGVNSQLATNVANAENTNTDNVTSFDTDGFSVGASANYNDNTRTYVAWNWLAGNGTSSNTSGSISSTISVNQKAGFSVVSYTGTAASATVGHGLGAKPAMLIVKKRTSAAPGGNRGWSVWHQSLATDKVLELNTSNAQLTEANFFIEGNINSTTFGVGADYNTGWTDDYIAYCFAEVEGFSRFGSYVGNGSTDGPMLYLGFEPAFFLAKRIDGVENWFMIDNARHPYNDGNIPRLLPNTSNAEAEDASIAGDFLSNGFKIRATQNMINTSGANYIYMAFAYNPFKFANAR